MIYFSNMNNATNTVKNMVRQIKALLILTLVISRTLSEDVPEFQYPCYVDVCTFPSQFCNSDKYERRCSPCSRAICRQTNVPLACRYICMKHNEITTTLKPSSATLTPSKQQSSIQGNDNLASLHLIMSYSAISTTLLVVVLLAFVAYYIHRKKLAKEKRKRNENLSVSYRTCLNRDRNYDPGEGLLQEITPDNREICHYCGHIPRPETLNLQRTGSNVAPPSYATCDQGKPIFPSDTPSIPSSTESVQNPAKTVLVKPQPKVDNNLASDKNGIRHKNVIEAEMQTPLLESLINSRETRDTDETSLKMSNI